MSIIAVLLFTILTVLPFYFPSLFFLNFFSFIAILYLIKNNSIGKSFKYGWIMGFIYISLSSYWLFFPLNDFSGLPTLLSLILLIILFILISIFYAIWAYLLKKIGVGAVRAALTWTAVEYLRYKILSFFPVSYLAYTQSAFKPLIQWADLGGIFLISFIIMLINGYFYKLIYTSKKKYLIPILIIFVIIGSYGFYSINKYSNYEKLNEFKLALIQTNIDQSVKWEVSRIDKNINLIFSSLENVDNVDLVITPETALTFDIIRNEYYSEKLFELVKNRNAYFQFGAQAIKEKEREKYNSSFLISPDGEIISRYNKNKLLPFGETIPFNKIVNYLTNSRWYSLFPGDKSPIFNINSVKWKNLICSEIFYPILDDNLEDFDFIVNQSNEAWFDSGLQEEMWTAAVFRAVESRKTVVKTGNFAKSGVILPTGKHSVLEDMKSDKVINAKIVKNNERTFYSKHGNYLGYISLIIVIILFIIKSIVNFKKERNDNKIKNNNKVKKFSNNLNNEE